MGISKGTGGSRGLQITLHQFFGTTHKLFVEPFYVSRIFMQHCVKMSLGPVTDLSNLQLLTHNQPSGKKTVLTPNHGVQLL
jgi:hypothetical protein